MPIQNDATAILSYRRQASMGAIAPNDATARHVPYVSHSLALSKNAIKSQEKRSSLQVATMRHGNRSVAGDLQLQLQTGTYSPLMESAMRRDFTLVPVIAAITTLTAAAVGAGGTFTRATGSWITDGLTVGMTVRMAGWTTAALANNARNYTIVALTALVMTVAEPVAAKVAGDSVSITVPGRVTWLPGSGHTSHAYTVEEWNPDVPRSNRFVDCRVNTMGINLQADDRVGLTFGMIGRDRQKNAARYFLTGVTAPQSVMQVGTTGLLVMNGTVVAILTALTVNLTNNAGAGKALASAIAADVFYGAQEVSGSLTAYFDTTVLDDAFDDETETSLILRVADDAGIGSGFVQICMPRLKLSSLSNGADSGSRVQTFEYMALEHAGTSGNQATTLLVQDSSLT